MSITNTTNLYAGRKNCTFIFFCALMAAATIICTPKISFSKNLVCTIQIGSYLTKDDANKQFNSAVDNIDGPLDSLRIEKIGKYYAVRLGSYSSCKDSDEVLSRIFPFCPEAITLSAHIKPERIIRRIELKVPPPETPESVQPFNGPALAAEKIEPEHAESKAATFRTLSVRQMLIAAAVFSSSLLLYCLFHLNAHNTRRPSVANDREPAPRKPSKSQDAQIRRENNQAAEKDPGITAQQPDVICEPPHSHSEAALSPKTAFSENAKSELEKLLETAPSGTCSEDHKITFHPPDDFAGPLSSSRNINNFKTDKSTLKRQKSLKTASLFNEINEIKSIIPEKFRLKNRVGFAVDVVTSASINIFDKKNSFDFENK